MKIRCWWFGMTITRQARRITINPERRLVIINPIEGVDETELPREVVTNG